MKKISTLMLLGLAFGSIQAAQISQSEAMDVASKYLAVSGPQKHLVRAMQKSQSGGNAPYYIFNATDGKGFVIVSGDDQLTELVGYSATGHIDVDDMPESLRAYLDSYAGYVARVQSGSAEAYSQPLSTAEAVVAPLVKAHWNQTEPYNNLCPMDASTGKRSVVGCVATAMAQVCDYWKWPLKPQPFSNSYRCSNTTRVDVDFSKSEYDWDNMLDSYLSTQTYTDAQANAVAKLSFDMGAAVNMDYSSSASGAQDANIPYALCRFGYKCQLYYRSQYTKTTFIDLIKSELDAARPMIFSGQGSAGGHCFVADGYDSNGFIHINWGWGGVSDGYFDVDAMNPPALGTGGGDGGFNSDQSVIAVEKDATMTGSSGQLPLTIYNMYGYVGYVKPVQSSLKKGEQLDVAVQQLANYTTVHDYTGNLTVGIYDSSLSNVAMSTIKNAQIPAMNLLSSELTYSFKDQLKVLPDGKYTIWAVSRELDNTTTYDWMRVGNTTPVVMNVKGDDITFGEELELALAEPVTADKNPINPGDKVKFSIKLSNKNLVNLKGSMLCELRNAETGALIVSTKPSVALGGKETVDVIVTMTMMKASVKVGHRYAFSVVSFNNGSTDFEIADSQPFEFVAGEAGVEDVAEAGAVSVYPNPTEGFVNVNAPGGVLSVEAYSADGRLAARSEGVAAIDLSGCAGGVYLLRVATEGGVTVHRVVKK